MSSLYRVLGVSIVVLLVNCCPAWGQRWWQGVLPEVGLIMNLEQTDSAWVFYSPTQTDKPFVATKWDVSNDTLHFYSAELGLQLTLEMKPQRMKGRFKQGMVRSEVEFAPAQGLYEMRRPQTPKPPFDYDTQRVEVTYDGVTLTGMLTMPRGKKSVPAVVLVSGSGQQNMDSEIMKHKPFLVLADYLSSNGVAVLRYNDRGVNGSTGDVETATTIDFAKDAEQMFEWLRAQPRIDAKRVGIIGHSEGGLIAPMVASGNVKVAKVVMLAGPGYNGAETLLQQNRAIYELQGVDSELVKVRLHCLKALFEGEEPNMEEINALTTAQRKQIGLTKGNMIQLRQQLQIPWMRDFLMLDPAQYLPKVKCPILAIGGDKDCQVLAKINLERIKQLNPKAKTICLPNLNHLLQYCETGSVMEYQQIEETLSPEVMRLVLNFVKK